jgi:hypothetical protein
MAPAPMPAGPECNFGGQAAQAILADQPASGRQIFKVGRACAYRLYYARVLGGWGVRMVRVLFIALVVVALIGLVTMITWVLALPQ